MTNDFRSYDHKQMQVTFKKRKSLVVTHYSLLITRNTNTRNDPINHLVQCTV